MRQLLKSRENVRIREGNNISPHLPLLVLTVMKQIVIIY